MFMEALLVLLLASLLLLLLGESVTKATTQCALNALNGFTEGQLTQRQRQSSGDWSETFRLDSSAAGHTHLKTNRN